MGFRRVFGFDATRFMAWILILVGTLLNLFAGYLLLLGDPTTVGDQAFESVGIAVGNVAVIAGLGLEVTGIRLEAIEEELTDEGS